MICVSTLIVISVLKSSISLFFNISLSVRICILFLLSVHNFFHIVFCHIFHFIFFIKNDVYRYRDYCCQISCTFLSEFFKNPFKCLKQCTFYLSCCIFHFSFSWLEFWSPLGAHFCVDKISGFFVVLLSTFSQWSLSWQTKQFVFPWKCCVCPIFQKS